jgi:catechol 2,3-dioxygenase-like lactoylglutathione lyase family enzyme
MKSLGFHHIAIFARDVERLARFYREQLQLKELRRFLRDDGSLRSIWLSARAGGGERDGFLAIEAEAGEGGRGAQGFAMLALRIDPAAREEAKQGLLAAGYPLERETGWTMYVRDPEGNLVGLSHHPDAAPA